MNASAPTSITRGAAFTVAVRWSDRLIGIVSTIILARLLVPEDFGIIAMASLIIGLTDVLFDLGVHIALIRHEAPTPQHYHTAWTLRLAQAVFAALLVAATAPWAAQYFGDARVQPVLLVLGICLVITAFENMGVIDFQREMRFQLDFKFSFTKRIVGFLVTVCAAFLLQSYWAMVIGTLAGRTTGVILSYRMHSLRPQISLSKFGEIFAVSQWLMVRTVLDYLNINAHKFVIGTRAGADILAGYTLASQISSMPSSELLAPLNRVLFPAFVKSRNNTLELKRVFLLAQSVQTLVAVPASVLLITLAAEVVTLLLGPKWLFIVPFVQVFSLANIAQAIAMSGSYLLMTVGEFARQTALTFVQLSVFVGVAVLLIPSGDAIQVAWVRLAAIYFGLVLSISLLLHRVSPIRLRDMLATVTRPLLASLLMGSVVWVVSPLVSALGVLPGAALKGVLGVVIYVAAVTVLWRISGCPNSGERYLADKLRKWRVSRKNMP